VTPDALDAWTLQVIQEFAVLGVVENDRFDFKADLQPAEPQRKTVTAFANSNGGFLVYGVTNDRHVEGVTNVELVRDFGSKLRDGLSPSVDFEFAPHPHGLPNGRLVYVCHIPRSKRGPHAAYLNGAWTFLKRTAAGTNEPMTYEEIRDAFTETARRKGELAWLAADVKRIGELAYHMNVTGSHSGWKLDLLLSRFDASQIRTLTVSVFGFLQVPGLVEDLQSLVARCMKVDALLAPLAAFAMSPRDRSYSGAPSDPLGTVHQQLPQIIFVAERIVKMLEERLR
jgi:hypothetical protein